MCNVYLLQYGDVLFCYVVCIFELMDEVVMLVCGLLLLGKVWFVMLEDFVLVYLMVVFVSFVQCNLDVEFVILIGLLGDLFDVFDEGWYDFVFVKCIVGSWCGCVICSELLYWCIGFDLWIIGYEVVLLFVMYLELSVLCCCVFELFEVVG